MTRWPLARSFGGNSPAATTAELGPASDPPEALEPELEPYDSELVLTPEQDPREPWSPEQPHMADGPVVEAARMVCDRQVAGLIGLTSAALWIGDPEGRTEHVSEAWLRLTGISVSEPAGQRLEQLLPPPLRPLVAGAIQRVCQDHLDFEAETYLGGRHQPWTPRMLVRVRALRDDGGRLVGLIAGLEELAARGPAAAPVHMHAELLDLIDASVVAADDKGTITYWNEGARRLYGFTAGEAVGRNAVDLLAATTSVADSAKREREMLRTGHWEEEMTVRRKDGTSVAVYARHVLLRDRGTLPAAVSIAVDLTQRKHAEARLADARGYLAVIANSMEEGLCALNEHDHVAYMNPAAERMLGWNSDELRGKSLHSVTHSQQEDGAPFPERDCPITQSRMQGRSVRVDDDVFFRKDGVQLPVEYTASPTRTPQGPPGSVIVFRDITGRRSELRRYERELEALAWVGHIRDALDQDRFVLYAQPVIDLATGDVIQHELLIRMVLDGAIVAPGEFLPVAEESGLIEDIDRWVVGQAALMAAEGKRVMVNLSAISIANPRLLVDIDRALVESGAPPANLFFEITETALLSDEVAALSFATEMNRLGCRVALDDFGTGYGGFTFLKRLPIQCLKIDAEFVTDVVREPASRHVVEAVVQLAQRFGLKTIAEGVEEEETLNELRALGVDHAQGYLLGRPAPAREVLHLNADGEVTTDGRQE